MSIQGMLPQQHEHKVKGVPQSYIEAGSACKDASPYCVT